MFWPAEVAGKPEKGEVDLKYDNNAIRKAELVHLQPPEGDVPVKFGKEVESLAAGEFCEVFNNSKQDPGSWVVKIKKLLHIIVFSLVSPLPVACIPLGSRGSTF